MNEHGEDELIKSVIRSLDEGVQGIDAETRSRLNQARQRALAEQKGQKHTDEGIGFDMSVLTRRWMPLGGMTAAAAVAVFWLANPEVQKVSNGDFDNSLAENATSIEKTSLPIQDDALFVSEYWEEDPDLMEDMEFVAWLIDEELMNESSIELSLDDSNAGDHYAG